MALLNEEETEPAIFTASWYSLLCLPLAKCRHLLTRDVYGFQQDRNGHLHEVVKSRMEGDRHSDAQAVEPFAVLGL